MNTILPKNSVFQALTAFIGILLLTTAAQAQWLQTANGSYDYNTAANWTAGNINGVFPSTLVLPASTTQNITFSADSTLSSGLTFTQDASAASTTLRFMGSGANRTITLGGDLVYSPTSGASTTSVIIGSATANQNLNVALGADRVITSTLAGNTGFGFINNVSGAFSITKRGSQTLIFDGATTFSGNLNIENGLVYLSSQGTLGGVSAINLGGVYNGSANALAALRLDNRTNFFAQGVVNLSNRVNDSAAVNASGAGQFIFAGSTSNAAETIGSFNNIKGLNVVNSWLEVSANTGSNSANLTISNLVRTAGSQMLFGGGGRNSGQNTNTNSLYLGQGTVAGLARIQLTQINGGAVSSALQNGILPWAVVGDGTNRFFYAFATNSTNGLKAYGLDGTGAVNNNGGTEVYGTSIAGGNATTNVRITASEALSADASVNSLTVAGTSAWTVNATSARTITIASGGLIAGNPANNVTGNFSSNITLDFNGKEANIFANYGTTFLGKLNNNGGNGLNLSSSVTATRSGIVLDLAAGSTITGPIRINNGDVWFTANVPVADLYIAANGFLTTSSVTATTTTSIGALSGEGVARGSNAGNAGTRILQLGNGDGSATFTGSIQDGDATKLTALEKVGTGTQTLAGNNTYTGATTITAGTLQFAKTASLYNGTSANWTAANIIVNSGGTLALNVGGAGEFISANVDTINSLGGAPNGLRSGSTLALDTTNAGGSFTHSGNISNTNGGVNVLNFTKLGSGTLTLNGTNTYTGNTTISAGTLQIGGGGSLGSGAYSGNISNSGVFTLNTSAAQTLSGTVSGNGSFAKSNTNTVVLSGNNTYSGGTTLSAGTLQIGHANALGTSGTITLGGGTLQYGNGITTDLSSRFSTAASQAYNIDTGINNVTYASALTSSGGTLSKNGSGMLTLSNAGNTYSGATTVNAGTLSLASVNASSAITVNSGGALIGTATAGTVTVNSGGFIGAGNAAATPGTLTVGALTLNGGSTYTWDFGNVSGTAGTNWDLLNVTGSLTINATNTTGNKFTVAITGTPTGWAPSTSQTWNIINYGSLANAFDATVFDYTTSLSGAGTWSFTNNSSSKFIGLTYTVSSTSTWTGGAGNWSSGFSTVPVNGNALVFSGAGGTATNDIVSGNLTSLTTITINSTAGSYTLAANSGSSGFNASTPLTITGVTNNSANATTVNLALAVTNSPLAINAAAGNITMGGPISNNNTITFSGANSTTVSGAISGTGGIAQSGTGALTLSAANTYAGDTTISAGSLQITGSGSLGTGATYSGNISNSGTFTLNTTTDQTLAGIISGNGAFVKSNTNTVILSGANTFTGNTTINAGTLRINGTGTLGNATYAGTITNNGTLFFNSSTNQTLSGVISGSGALTQNGSSTLTLSGNNTYSGATTIAAGTLLLSGNGTLGTNTISISGGTLDMGGKSLTNTFGSLTGGTLSNGTLTNNGSTFALQNGAVSAVLAGTNGVSKTTSDTVTLSGANTYTGTTTVTAGTLATSAADRISDSSAVTVAAGGTFQLGGSETVGSIAGAGNYSIGNYTLTAGSSGNPSTTVSGAISGTGGRIDKRGTGTLTLSGNNSFTGDLQVGNGTVSVASIGNVGSASNAGSGNIILGTSTLSASLAYTGTGETSNKTIDLGSRSATLTINASGSGLLKLTSNFTSSSRGSKTLALGGSGLGEIAGAIVDAASGSTLLNAQTNNGTNQLTLASTANVSVGAAVSGTGIAPNTTVQSISGSVVTLNNNTTAQLNSGAAVTIAGVLNPTAITKSDAGTWTLSGNNSYTGATTISVGILNIQHANALGATSGNTTVSSGAALQLQGGITVGAEALSLAGTGVNSDGTGALRNISGNNAYGGVISLAGATTIGSDAGNLTLSSGSSITGTNTNLTIVGAGNTTINDTIATGTGTLTKNGSGTLTLGGSNSYTGATTLNAGNISFSTTAALANSSSLSMANATALIYTGGTASLDRAITVTSGTGTIRNTGLGTLTLSGALTKNGTTLTFDTGAFNVTGAIGGANAGSDLVVDGATVTLNSANTYNGPTSIIDGGTLTANVTGALPTANGRTAISIDATGTGSSTLAVGANQSIASLTGAASSNVTLGSNTLTVGTTSGSTTYAGRITGGASSALVKDGESTQVLSGNNTGFTGTTTINNGTLTANSANALGGTTTIDVNGGSLLVAAANAINDNANIRLNGGRLAVNGNFDENVGALTLSANSTIDFSGFSGILRFSGLSWASGASNATLAIWNWSGNTAWGTQINNYQNPSQLVFTNSANLTTSDLAKINFYSDSGFNSIGSGFIDSSFTGGGNLIIAVPEPETVITAVILLLGFTFYQIRLARHGQGLLSCLTFLRSRGPL